MDGNQDSSQSDALGLKSGEPNDTFEDAIIALVNDDRAELQGTISQSGDIDVFDLGPVNAGDRLVVSIETYGSGLDPAIALFDAEGRLFMDNDDRSINDLDSRIDEVARHDGDPYYLAVGHSAFTASPANESGGYWVTVTITRDGEVPAPRGQTLFLDFDGGTVTDPAIVDINNFGEEVMPFSGERIAPLYADATEVIKDSIVLTVEENFEGLDVDVITSDEGLPAVDDYSTIYFGSRSDRAFGISEAVDHYNGDPSDVAVIFTESFTPSVFSDAPRPRELGVAIGNVAAHEAGHLLGLNHVVSPADLMDTAYPPDTFLSDQEFGEAPLSDQIMDLGTQDALLLLAEILGLL